ncbi:chemotaxis protein CheW [Rheinheimera riviphila]|uniref:Chemotaxis protein CheW n=1 Tax=Rheinheimera riviphila TaxID=1834037 RepID=A0A437R1C8_9GAMM|nr:chemotaxis protein CheW [Rheinheimera riviphila]RVU40579.1 chemotaxis protein CheW [Rheinheimera riviphila]
MPQHNQLHAKSATSDLYLLFQIAADFYAIQAVQVDTVLSVQPLKQLPATPDWLCGLLYYQGQVVPVIDLYQRLLGRPAVHKASTRLVLVKVQHQHQHQQILGLLLEKVNRFVRLPTAAWTSANVQVADHHYLAEVQQHSSGLIQRIQLAALLPDDVRLLLQKTQAQPDE